MPFDPFFTLRPSWFHAYSPATLDAEGICLAISRMFPNEVAMESAHRGEVGGESFGVSCLKLLDEELYVGGDDFFARSAAWRLRAGKRGCWLVVVALVCGGMDAHGVVSPFLNGCAVFVHKHALALAHASRGGKCKGRGISHPERPVEGGRRPVCTSEARKTGDTPCARQGRSPSGGLVSLALRAAHE